MNNFKTYLREYGLLMLLTTGFSRVLRKLNLSDNILTKYDCFKHKKVQKYLKKQYGYLVNSIDHKEQAINKEVYVFWWQGEDQAPDIVKLCINSIRKNAGMRVIVLSQDNYDQYVNIPDYIVKKMREGKMCLAHFSDIIRFNLLYFRGGVWIDATNLCTSAIPEHVLSYSFFSIKDAYDGGLGWQWTSFYMCAQKHDYLCGLMVDFYNHYWFDHDTVITYLVLDCWLRVLYEENNLVQLEIDKLPEKHIDVFALSGLMNEIYTKELFEHAKSKSYLHKLTYKEKYLFENSGQQTIFGVLSQDENPHACQLEN